MPGKCYNSAPAQLVYPPRVSRIEPILYRTLIIDEEKQLQRLCGILVACCCCELTRGGWVASWKLHP